MKTAEIILHRSISKEYLDKLPRIIIDAIIKSHKEYASKAIDKLVEEYQRGDDFDIKIYAEKIKSELK